MRKKSQRTVVVNCVSLKPEHWAIIDAHAKDSGLISRSAGLRGILDEWRAEKTRSIATPQPARGPA